MVSEFWTTDHTQIVLHPQYIWKLVEGFHRESLVHGGLQLARTVRGGRYLLTLIGERKSRGCIPW